MNFIKTISMIAAGAMLAAAVFATTDVETTVTTDQESLALFVAGDNVAFATGGGGTGPVGPGGPSDGPSDGGTCIWLPFFRCFTPTGIVPHFLNVRS